MEEPIDFCEGFGIRPKLVHKNFLREGERQNLL